MFFPQINSGALVLQWWTQAVPSAVWIVLIILGSTLPLSICIALLVPYRDTHLSHWSELCWCPLSWGGRVLVLISKSHCFNRTHLFWDSGGCRCEPETSTYWLHKLSAALWPLWIIFGG